MSDPNSHRDDKTPLGEALEFAERWKGVHTDESYGPQGKIMGTLSRELLALHAQLSETRPTSTGEWQWPVDTVGKLIDSLKTLPPEMPFSTAYFVEIDGVRVARTKVPSISYETVSNGRVQKFDAANKSLVMWASQDEAHRCVARPSEDAVLMAQTAIERFGSRRFDKLTLDQADQLRMAREILRLHERKEP